MLRKLWIGFVAALVIFMTLSAQANSWKSLSTIETPERGQKLYSRYVEIVVKFKDEARPQTFEAWLNGTNITLKFEPIERGMKALVGPGDGLKAYQEKVETTRDDKGVWFVSGSSRGGSRYSEGLNFLKTKIRGTRGTTTVDQRMFLVDARVYDAFEAMGYAVATDRMWQGELYRRQARGKLSEIMGMGFLGTDIYFRTLGYSDLELKDTFDSLDPETKGIINGYIAGFNRRIAEVRNDPTILPFEFAALGFVPEDWTVLDLLAWVSWLQRFFDAEALETGQIQNAALYQTLAANFPADYQGMFDDLRWINDPDALTYIPGNVNAEPASVASKAAPRKMAAMETIAALPDLRTVAENMVARRNEVVEKLKKINAYAKLGSYAWTISGNKTASGNPMIYSGPQMGFPVPSIVLEGSIRAAGLNVSGMSVTGVPLIIIGRTPHHAWSMQVGHTHTVDYYLEDPAKVSLHRVETIKIAGGDDVALPIYRSAHGPVINPMPYNPLTYVPDPANPIISWKYAQWGYEATFLKATLALSRARSMDDFGKGIENINFSIHYCYADKEGNIAYWMAGRDPVRPTGEWRLPQGLIAPGLEWDSEILIPRSTDRNTSQGFYGGWNNKSSPAYNNSYNGTWGIIFGPFHRAHVIDDYLSSHNNLTFEEVRDLALNIATTDSLSIGDGGNPWQFVKEDFVAAVTADHSSDRQAALNLLADWDGHFVANGPSEWVWGTSRSEGWILMNTWINEVLRMIFEDELGVGRYAGENKVLLFNVLLHGLAGRSSGVVNQYDWFQNLTDSTAPQTAHDIIVKALDKVLVGLGDRPWTAERGEIVYTHGLIGEVWRTPYSNRSTYAHIVEVGPTGPVRIESMFPLGESGNILLGPSGPVLDEHFLSMTPVYDAFSPRPFPLFY